MKNPFGPWATTMHVGPNAQLSAFWKRRMAMLSPTSKSSPGLSRRIGLCLLAAGTAICILPTFRYAPALADGDPRQTLRSVTEAWRRRAEKFRSARFVLRTENTDAYENVLDIFLDRDETPSVNAQTEGTKIPKVFEYTLTTKISIDGVRMRYELEGERPIGSKLGRQDYVSAYNGEVSKSLTHPNADFNHPSGHIYRMKRCEATSTFYAAPILWTYALLEQAVTSIDLDKLTLSSREGVIGDRNCIILEQKSEEYTFGGDQAFWVDPSKDYAIVRHTIGTGDHVAAQLDCTYRFDPEDGWVPSRWTTRRFRGDGTPRTTGKTEVVEYEINPKFKSDEFEITFPAGTVVSDERLEKRTGRTRTLD